MMGLRYLAVLGLAFGLLHVIGLPLFWFIEFWVNWVFSDDVIALGHLERSVRSSPTALSVFATGMLHGVLWALIATGYRLLNGYWPHQQ